MNKKNKKTKYTLVTAAVILLAAVCASVTAIYAWFVDLTQTSRVLGTTLTVISNNVTLGELTLDRKSPLSPDVVQTTYTPDEFGVYRLEGGEQLYLSGLSDGEEFAFTLRFALDESYDRYSVSLAALSGEALTNSKNTVLGAVQYYSASGWVWLENDDGTRPSSFKLLSATAAGGESEEIKLQFRINFARIADKTSVKGKCFTLGTFEIVGEKS